MHLTFRSIVLSQTELISHCYVVKFIQLTFTKKKSEIKVQFLSWKLKSAEMPPKKIKLSKNQPTLSMMFVKRQAEAIADETTDDERETESKQPFPINLMIVQVQNERECGIDWTLLFNFDSRLISGTSSHQIASESEVEIECVESCASSSKASTSTQQADTVDYDESSASSIAMHTEKCGSDEGDTPNTPSQN